MMLAQFSVQDVEVMGHCPICGSRSRHDRFFGLTDRSFAVADGNWSLWDCDDCRATYLDPRPAAHAIGRAYSRYYTHAPAPVFQLRAASWRGRVAQGIRNDWLNRRLGHTLPGALPGGALIADLMPRRLRRVLHAIRHLPGPTRPGALLLDAGCGGGEFLQVASQLGYQARGIDFDQQAVARAQAIGLDVHQAGLPGTRLPSGCFEHVTASHIVEHLHDPLAGLRELFDLLTPGGRLWLSQPNMGACGLAVFGKDWRGLEPPRHLTMFDTQGMRALLERVGFQQVTLLPPIPSADFYFRQSLCQRMGVDPNRNPVPPGWGPDWEGRVAAADRAADHDPAVAENMTFVAWKP